MVPPSSTAGLRLLGEVFGSSRRSLPRKAHRVSQLGWACETSWQMPRQPYPHLQEPPARPSMASTVDLYVHVPLTSARGHRPDGCSRAFWNVCSKEDLLTRGQRAL
jgi:hypothetical protein